MRSVSLPMISLKLVLRSHSADVELPVIESAQSPRFRRPASISIQGERMDAMYLSKCLCSETKFFWEFEAPSKTFVRISSKAKRTRIRPINVSQPAEHDEVHVDAPFCDFEEIKH